VNLSGLGSSEAFIWNVGTGKLTARLDLDTVVTRAFQFSADGKLAAVTAGLAARNGFVLPAGIDIYNTTTGRRLSRLDVTGLTEIMFSPDGNRLLVVEGERNITLWDVHMGVKLVSLSEPGDTDPRDTVTSIASMDFNPDGTRLVSVSSDGDVWLWDTGSGKALIPLRQSSGPYLVREIPVMAERYGLLSRSTGTKQFSISFSPDGRQITLMTVLSNPKDATIRIETWDGSPRRQ
jgi:WD40 repeat protein